MAKRISESQSESTRAPAKPPGKHGGAGDRVPDDQEAGDRQDGDNDGAETCGRIPPLDGSIRAALENPDFTPEKKLKGVVSHIVRAMFGNYEKAAPKFDDVCVAFADVANRYGMQSEVMIDCFRGICADKSIPLQLKMRMPAPTPTAVVEGINESPMPEPATLQPSPSPQPAAPRVEPDVDDQEPIGELVKDEATSAGPSEGASETSSTPLPAKILDKRTNARGRKSAVRAAGEAVSTVPPVIPSDTPPPSTLAATPDALASAQSVTMVPISEIRIEPNRRKLHDVEPLKVSIADNDLLHPIIVTQDYRLVDGHHRVEAFRQLGRLFIPAIIRNFDDLHAELAEIDGNLVRADLTVLERGEQLLRRKAIYETLHPEAKVGSAPGKAGGGKVTRAKNATVASFADSTAATALLSARTVQEDIQIAGSVSPDLRDAIRDTPLADAKRDLLALARLPADKQKAIVDLMVGGQVTKFAEAKRQACGETEGKAKPMTKIPESEPTDAGAVGNDAMSEVLDSTLPVPASATGGSTVEAREALEYIEAVRSDPAVRRLEKLMGLGYATVRYGFDDDEAAAATAALSKQPAAKVVEFAQLTGYHESELRAAVLLAITQNNVPNDVWAEFVGEATTEAA